MDFVKALKRRRWKIPALLFAILLVGGGILGILARGRGAPGQPYAFDYGWTEEAPLIAHAFGGIGHRFTYTNSLEAFEENYAKGHRVFEVDFDLTNEYAMIAAHDEQTWRSKVGCGEEAPYTLDYFLSVPIYDRFTPMDCRRVVELMNRYPDIYIVTDSKYTDEIRVTLQFSQLVQCARRTNPEVLDRIIPQIYHEEMLDWIMRIHPFRSVIFTLYMTEWTPESVFDFCSRSGVRFITMWDYLVTPEILELWNSIGIETAVHTVNGVEDAMNFYEMGVNVIYTDYLQPADVAARKRAAESRGQGESA